MRFFAPRPSSLGLALVLVPGLALGLGSACSMPPTGGDGDGGTSAADGGATLATADGSATEDGATTPPIACTKNDDCPSKLCETATGLCRPASCTDGTRNGGETDTDCGGACPKCDQLKSCAGPADCASGVCVDAGKGLQCQAPTCTDSAKNAAESDVDCGGDKCGKCADGKACSVRADCLSDVCVANKCVTPVCDDGSKNGTETDVDCGGPGCPRCQDTQACTVADDCKSGVCTGGVCQAPACNDGVKNGDETDLDCGGATCAGCATGLTCVTGNDCASKGCNYLGKCAAGRSCTQRYGGDTCGLGGQGGQGAEAWEDCCAKAPVVPTTGPTAGQTIKMDKYQVTAGRMRVFLESINYDVRTFVQQARVEGKIPPIPNQAGANAGHSLLEPEWDKYLPVSFMGNGDPGEIADGDQAFPNVPEAGIYTSVFNHLGGRIFKNNAQGSTGCYVGSPGTHAFRFPDNKQDGSIPEHDQNVYDTKSMQCVDYLVAQAFCVWDGGRLHLGTEWVAGWGAGALPWTAQTTRPPAVIGDATYFGCRFPTVGDGNYPAFCTTGFTPATQTIEHAAYRYSYEYPNLVGSDYIVFISAPGRTLGRGPNGHADIIGTNYGLTSDVGIGRNTNNAVVAYDGTPFTANHGWNASGSWEVHGYAKPASGLSRYSGLLNKYGKLGLRCVYP